MAYRKPISLASLFTRCYDGETPYSVDDPVCFDDGCSGTEDTDYIVRARPIGPQTGGIPLVLELLDLLHIQLACLAGERVVRGAAVIDSPARRTGPRRRARRPRAVQGP